MQSWQRERCHSQGRQTATDVKREFFLPHTSFSPAFLRIYTCTVAKSERQSDEAGVGYSLKGDKRCLLETSLPMLDKLTDL